jgi:hypothetical protein
MSTDSDLLLEKESWRTTAIHLGQALERIRKLHKKRLYINNHGEFSVCDYCTALQRGVPADYPCGTIRVLEGRGEPLAVLAELPTK